MRVPPIEINIIAGMKAYKKGPEYNPKGIAPNPNTMNIIPQIRDKVPIKLDVKSIELRIFRINSSYQMLI